MSESTRVTGTNLGLTPFIRASLAITVLATIFHDAQAVSISNTTLQEHLATTAGTRSMSRYNPGGNTSYVIDNMSNPSGMLDSIGITLNSELYSGPDSYEELYLNPIFTTYSLLAWRNQPTNSAEALLPDLFQTGLGASSATLVSGYSAGTGSPTYKVYVEAAHLNIDLSQYMAISIIPMSDNNNIAYHGVVLATNGVGPSLQTDTRFRRLNGVLDFRPVSSMVGVDPNTKYGAYEIVTTPVPEPSALLALGTGLGMLAKKRKHKALPGEA